MGRWDIARVDDVHVVAMTTNKGNAMNRDFFSEMQAAIAELQSAEALPVVLRGQGTCFCAAPTLERMVETQQQVNREFLDVWFSDGGRRRLGEMRARLLRQS